MRARKKDQKKASLQSTLAIQRQRAITDLVASLAALGDTAAGSLEECLRPVLEEGEEMPDLRLLFRLLERLAGRAGCDLDVADGDRFVRALRLKVLQEETRRAKAELHGEMVTVRKALVDLYGSAHVRFRFGLAERTPRGTADLADEALRLASRLSDQDLALPAPLIAGLAPDPKRWIETLKPRVERLERLLEERLRRRVGATDGVLAQRQALQACDETYLRVAHAAEALLRLGGERELARRLRPKAKRKPRRPAIVRAAVSWWSAAVTVLRRVGMLVAGGLGRVRRWADWRKPAGFRLAGRFPKPPNV